MFEWHIYIISCYLVSWRWKSQTAWSITFVFLLWMIAIISTYLSSSLAFPFWVQGKFFKLWDQAGIIHFSLLFFFPSLFYCYLLLEIPYSVLAINTPSLTIQPEKLSTFTSKMYFLKPTSVHKRNIRIIQCFSQTTWRLQCRG